MIILTNLSMKYNLAILISIFFINANGQSKWVVDKNGCKVFDAFDIIEKTAEWKGDCIDGLTSGNRSLNLYSEGVKSKNTFIGVMKGGKFEGVGEYEFSNDVKFEGEFELGYFKKGKLVENLDKEEFKVYEGEFKKGLANGHGTYYTMTKVRLLENLKTIIINLEY